MSTFLRHLSTAAIACVLSSHHPVAGAPQAFDAIVRVLNAYHERQYDVALGQLRSVGNSRAIRSRLNDHAQNWVEAGPSQSRDRRWRIAAMVALESAHVGFQAAGQPSVPYSRRNDQQLFETRELMELGCRWLRQSPPTEFERLWLLASVALVQSVQNHYQAYTALRFFRNIIIDPDVPIRPILRALENELAAVSNPPRGRGAFLTSPDEWTMNANIQEWDLAHRAHATSRFPHEPRFGLARILARPEARRMPNRPATSAFFMAQGMGVAEFDGIAWGEAEAKRLVEKTFVDLEAFLKHPEVSAEAHLRRAILQFHRANLAESLEELRHATKTSDRDIAYVAHIYTGLALDGLNRRKEAIDAFEAALRLVPGAPSAVMALVADLFLADRRAEASARLEAAFAKPAPMDPWKRFSLGDYRFWPTYLQQLREALGQ
jgi:hypothetical protein